METRDYMGGLDWKTLDNAKEKAYQTKTKRTADSFGVKIERDVEKVKFFQMAKASAINRKYFKGEDEATYFPNGGHFAKGEFDMMPSVSFGRLTYSAGGRYDNSPIMCHCSGAFIGNMATKATREEVLKAFNGDESKTDNFIAFCREYHDFKKGRINYVSGKGWTNE